MNAVIAIKAQRILRFLIAVITRFMRVIYADIWIARTSRAMTILFSSLLFSSLLFSSLLFIGTAQAAMPSPGDACTGNAGSFAIGDIGSGEIALLVCDADTGSYRKWMSKTGTGNLEVDDLEVGGTCTNCGGGGISEPVTTLKFTPQTSAPFTCDNTTSSVWGTIAVNNAAHLVMTAQICICTYHGWKSVGDNSNNCVWNAAAPPP